MDERAAEEARRLSKLASKGTKGLRKVVRNNTDDVEEI